MTSRSAKIVYSCYTEIVKIQSISVHNTMRTSQSAYTYAVLQWQRVRAQALRQHSEVKLKGSRNTQDMRTRRMAET